MSSPSPTTPAAAPLPTLSVSIVCCDNAGTIGRCVRSVAGLAHEIIAVDSGSTDDTTTILRRHGARVIHQPWLGFVKQKQFALEQCAGPWLLHLDSDESLEPALARAVRDAVRRDPNAAGDIAGYECNRKVWWAGKPLHHAWQPEWRLRLVQRDHARWTGHDPHDRLEVTRHDARTARIPGDMRHDAIADLPSFFARQVAHATVGAASYAQRGDRTRPAKLVTSPLGAWLRMMLRNHAWRDGWRGWAAATTVATNAAMKHAILLELLHREQRDAPTTNTNDDHHPPTDHAATHNATPTESATNP
jgi:glycosyltransferase involved in cell wall biosynthesis